MTFCLPTNCRYIQTILFGTVLQEKVGGGGDTIPCNWKEKYREGTNSRPHAYNTLSVLYIEGEAWQEPLQEKQGYKV